MFYELDFNYKRRWYIACHDGKGYVYWMFWITSFSLEGAEA